MARPRCDPFDAAAIRAAIASGNTTECAAYLAPIIGGTDNGNIPT